MSDSVTYVTSDKDWRCMIHAGLYITIPAGLQRVTRAQAKWGIANGRCEKASAPKKKVKDADSKPQS